jgi:hypothetical protein
VKVESEPAGGGGGAVGASVWPLPPVGAAWGVPKNLGHGLDLLLRAESRAGAGCRDDCVFEAGA